MSVVYYDLGVMQEPEPRTVSAWKWAAVIVLCAVCLGGVLGYAVSAPPPHSALVQHNIARSIPAQTIGAAMAAATLANSAAALEPAQFFDYRDRKAEFDVPYEALDSELTVGRREGLDQARTPEGMCSCTPAMFACPYVCWCVAVSAHGVSMQSSGSACARLSSCDLLVDVWCWGGGGEGWGSRNQTFHF